MNAVKVRRMIGDRVIVETFDEEKINKVATATHDRKAHQSGHAKWDTERHRFDAAFEHCRSYETAQAMAVLSALGLVEVEEFPAEWLSIPVEFQNAELLSVNGVVGEFFRDDNTTVFMRAPVGAYVEVCSIGDVTSVEPVTFKEGQ